MTTYTFSKVRELEKLPYDIVSQFILSIKLFLLTFNFQKLNTKRILQEQLKEKISENQEQANFIDKICANVKSYVTCKICNQVFAEAVKLPCSNTVCKNHLSSINKVECYFCKTRHDLTEDSVESNELITQAITESFHLTVEEKRLKQKIENLFSDSKTTSETLISKEASLEVACYDHFAEIMNSIDQKKEQLKIEIDDLSDALISRVKECKATHENALKHNSSQKVLNLEEILKLESNFSQDSRHLKDLKGTFEAIKTKLEENRLVLDKKTDALEKTHLDLYLSSINTNTMELETSVFGNLSLKKSCLPVPIIKADPEPMAKSSKRVHAEASSYLEESEQDSNGKMSYQSFEREPNESSIYYLENFSSWEDSNDTSTERISASDSENPK